VISSGWIGLAVQFDFVEYWMLVAASAIQATAFAIYGPGRMAFIAELVPEGTIPNAIVLGQMSAESARVVGPTIAGILIGAATWGLATVFLASTVLCFLATLFTTTLPAGRPRGDRPQRSPFAELADGIRYTRSHPDLALLVTTSLLVVMAGYPYMAFLPTVADGIFDAGSGGYGLMSTVGAVGAVIAGLLTAGRSGSRDGWPMVTWAGFGFGLGLIALGAAPALGVALAVLVVLGAAGLTFQTTLNSLLLGRSDFEYHGRIQSLIMLGFSGFGIVALPLGVLADAIGLRTTLVIMGVAVLATTARFASRSRHARKVDELLDLG
jgi:MFS family permease